MRASSGAIRATPHGPTASCAGRARRGAARARRWKRRPMAIDFAPTLAYPRPHWRPPAFGGPFSLQRLKRFWGFRDEAHLPTEPPRAQAPPRLPRPQGHRRRPQGPGRPPRPRPQEAVGLSADAAPARLVRTLSKRSEFLAANRGLRFPMPGFVLLVRPRGDDDAVPGIGFTVS